MSSIFHDHPVLSVIAMFIVTKSLTYIELLEPYMSILHWLFVTLCVASVGLQMFGRILFRVLFGFVAAFIEGLLVGVERSVRIFGMNGINGIIPRELVEIALRISADPTRRYNDTIDLINEHTTLVQDPETDDKQCSICYGDYVRPVILRRLRCQHMFHPGCIDKWIIQSPTCPICKQGIVLVT